MRELDSLNLFFSKNYRFSNPSFSHSFLVIRVRAVALRVMVCTLLDKIGSPFFQGSDCGGCSVGGHDLDRFSCSLQCQMNQSRWPYRMSSSISSQSWIHSLVSWSSSRWYKQNLFEFLQVGRAYSFRAFGSCPLSFISTFFLGMFNGV